jgi:hypothetical protein
MIEMSWMISEAGHPMWRFLLAALREKAHLPVLESTGPLLLTAVLQALPDAAKQGVILTTPEVAYPLDQWQTSTHSHRVCGKHDVALLATRKGAYTVSVEHWCGSWLKYEED